MAFAVPILVEATTENVIVAVLTETLAVSPGMPTVIAGVVTVVAGMLSVVAAMLIVAIGG